MLSMNVALCVQLKQRRFLCSGVRERPFDFYWGWWIMLSGLDLIFTRRAIMSFYLHIKQCLHSVLDIWSGQIGPGLFFQHTLNQMVAPLVQFTLAKQDFLMMQLYC